MDEETQEYTTMHYLGEGDILFACAANSGIDSGVATENPDLVTCDACKKAAKITGLVEDGSE